MRASCLWPHPGSSCKASRPGSECAVEEQLCSRTDGVDVVGLEGGRPIRSSCSGAPLKCRRPELRIVEVEYLSKKTGEIPK